jgi:hypothetical protein
MRSASTTSSARPSGSPLASQSFIQPTESPNQASIMATELAGHLALRAAAAVVCVDDFPSSRTLPRIASVPFANCGHSVLFDYGLFARLVWLAALEVKPLVLDWVSRRNRLLAVGSLAGICACVLGWSAAGTALGGLISALVVAVVALGVISSEQLRLARRVCARRAEIAEMYLAGRLLSGNLAPPPGFELHDWGNGRFDDDSHVPVVVAREGRTFPGFGREQLRKVFVCTSQRSDVSQGDGPALDEGLRARVLRSVALSGRWRSLVGDIIVVDGHTIRPGSPWLDGNMRPLLWLPAEYLADAETLDPLAAARRDLAIQILFPTYATAATLFVRSFPVGSAAAVEVVLMTLGPVEGTLADDGVIRYRASELRKAAGPIAGSMVERWSKGRGNAPRAASVAPLSAAAKTFIAGLSPFDGSEKERYAEWASEASKWPRSPWR